ncbi:MAG: autotransporter-associated beta strand repeat-containing protein [Akkermansia sp.]|nr:autotransporter-associated beta strand repeat-containing protein [Akkermansia sp.]
MTFSGNSATSDGGAIYVDRGTLNLTGNTSVTFSGNSATSHGGAIDVDRGTLNLTGNEHVVFQENYEQSGSGDSATYRLRSIYGYNSALNMSAGTGQDIVFYDTLYADTTSTVSFNAKYVDKDGVEQEATGDIVFSGKYAEDDLRKLKPNYTQQELTNSLTTEVRTTTNLYGGRLSIEDGAIYKGYGINVADGSHAALRLANSELNQADYTGRYDVTLASGTILDLQGVNKISAGSLDMQDGSILSFTLGEINLTKAALTLDGIFNQGGNLTISIQGDETYDPVDTYTLITMVSGTKPETWNIDKITLSGADTNVNHLWWENGVLYYRELPPLVSATWSGEQNRVWNFTDKNWTQDGDHYRYKDGVDVVFGDTGSGEVVLAYEVTPLSVLVENSAGHDYSITGEGSLAGATALTKEGAGKLTIATANTYEGGTVINGGTVALGSDTALGTGDIQLNDGVLDLGGNTIANNIITPEDAIVTIGNGITTGNLSLAYTELTITGNVQVDGVIQASLENMIIVDDGATLGISQGITNTGDYLDISGSIDISKMHGEVIGISLTGGENPANGFLGTTERVQVIDNVSGGEVYIDYANFYHMGMETQLDDNFMAEVVCSADYTVFYLNEDAEKLSQALKVAHAAGEELATVEMKSGTQLNVDSNANADLVHVESGTVTMNIAQGATLSETDTTRTDFVLQGEGRYSLMSGSTTLGATMGDTWQGIVQINGATFSALDLDDYGTANSTVSLNGVSAKLVDGTTFSPNLELLGDGLTITDFAKAGQTYVFTGNVSGSGNMTFNPSGMRHNPVFVFTGDVSQWTGTYENMVANRNSTLQFYGNATEIGAAIKQTAGAVSVIVGNGTEEHTTVFANTVEASSLTVQENAKAVLGGDTTITDSLTLYGKLETNGGSLSLGANATMQIGSAISMKANREGDVNVSDNTVIEATSMHSKDGGMGVLNNVNVDIIEDYTIENMSISGSVIDISEGKHLYVKHVNIEADARITDEAAWLDMVDTHGWLDNTNTEAAAPVMSLGDTLFYRSGDDAWVRLDHDVSYVALTSELFSNVTMTGSDLWLDLTGLADTIGSARAFSIAFKDALYDVNGMRVVATVDGEHYFDGYYTTKQEGTTTTLYFSSQIPEPTTSTLSLLALAALAARRRRK